MSERMTVAASPPRRKPSAARSRLARLGSHPPRLEGRLQLPGTQRRLLPRQHPGHRRRRAAELRIGDQAARRAGCSVTVDGEVKASPGKGQATEVHADRRSRSTAGPTPKPIRCRRNGTRSSSCATSPICGRGPTPSARSPGCGTASAARSTISSRKRASSTSTRRSSRPATAKGPARCSRSPRSTWPRCRRQEADGRFHRRTSSTGRRI